MDDNSLFAKYRLDNLSHVRAAAALTVLFVFTRLLLFTGFPFSMNFLNLGMQLLDPVHLRGRLFEGLFYQHIQPPLFNALVGGVLHLFPDEGTASTIFAFLYFLIGLLLVLGVYALAVNLGAGRGWSLAAASVYVFWPPNIIEQIFNHPPPEKWLSYDYPTMLILLAMALSIAMFRNRGGAGWLVCFLFLSTALVWTRPFFHSIWWFVPTVLLVMQHLRGARQRDRRILMVTACLALILSLAPAVKNRVLYGWFTDSSFAGMNIASRTLFLTRDTLLKEVNEGTVTSLALIPKFSEPEIYLEYYGEEDLTGNPVLDPVDKSTGHPNWTHYIMLRASKEYGANTAALLRAYPLELVKTAANGIYIFFGFDSHRFLWTPGMKPWGFWDVSFSPVKLESPTAFIRSIAVPIIFAVVFFTVMYRMYLGRGDPLCRFLLFAMVYVFIVSSFAELGHNNLFRKQVDPVLFAGLALWLTRFSGSTGTTGYGEGD